MRTSFHHQSEAQSPNGPLTAATSPDTPSPGPTTQSCANPEFPVSAEHPRFSAVWGGCNGTEEGSSGCCAFDGREPDGCPAAVGGGSETGSSEEGQGGGGEGQQALRQTKRGLTQASRSGLNLSPATAVSTAKPPVSMVMSGCPQ